MLRRDLFLSIIIFALLFIFQEAAINQIHLPFSGFNIVMIAALTWSAQSSPESATVTGFISGIFLDLMPSNDAPFGLWTLTMIIAAYAIAYFGASDEAALANPFGLVTMVATTVVLAQLFYLMAGLLFGLNFGSWLQMLRTLVGIGLWSGIVTPIILPFIKRVKAILYTSSL